jgi:hypothetical protein
VRREQLHPVVVPQLAVQAGGVLDVGEQDGHGAVSRRDSGDLVALLHRPGGEVVDRAQQHLAHAVFANLGGGLDEGLHRGSGGLQGPTAATRRTPLRVERVLELEHLGLGLGELLGEHADPGDRSSQQHSEEDRDHCQGGHAPTIAQARAPARATAGGMR